MRQPQIKPCRICNQPVSPNIRKDRSAYYYPKQCKKCYKRCRFPEERIKKLKETLKQNGHPGAKPVGTKVKHSSRKGLEYWRIKIHEPNQWQYDHRYVMEKHLKRQLKKSEQIHHIDGDTLNNSIENLQVVTTSEHLSIHHKINTWAKLYSACLKCNTKKIPHEGHGLCKQCHRKWRTKKKPMINEYIKGLS